MHTIEVDKITLFKTTLNNVFSPTCFDPHWIIIREVYTLLAKLLCRLINWKGDLVARQCCSGYVSLTRFVSTFANKVHSSLMMIQWGSKHVGNNTLF
jgi:hypothetical protein